MAKLVTTSELEKCSPKVIEFLNAVTLINKPEVECNALPLYHCGAVLVSSKYYRTLVDNTYPTHTGMSYSDISHGV